MFTYTVCLLCLQGIVQGTDIKSITCPFCHHVTSKDTFNCTKWVLPNNTYALQMFKINRQPFEILLMSCTPRRVTENQRHWNEQVSPGRSVKKLKKKWPSLLKPSTLQEKKPKNFKRKMIWQVWQKWSQFGKKMDKIFCLLIQNQFHKMVKVETSGRFYVQRFG